MNNSKNLIICADDYAQNAAISEGILQLAEKKRINAISCLVNACNWPQMQKELQQFEKTAWLGLHLNLTQGKALSVQWQSTHGNYFGKLSALIQSSYLQRLDKQSVAAEINAQLDAFTQATGKNPDFIDGHQHIHQLPVIREALLAIYQQRKLQAFCRNTSNGWRDFSSPGGFPKRQIISLLGGLTFKARLKQCAIPANASFAGIYNFANAQYYRSFFQQFLKQSKDNGLIMCHPGIYSEDLTDPLHPYRHFELQYFSSDAFLEDLNSGQFMLRPVIDQ